NMRFSQRYGHRPVKTVVQTNSVDDDLKNGLWSLLKVVYWDSAEDNGDHVWPGKYLSVHNDELQILFRGLWLSYFKRPLDTLPDAWEKAYAVVRTHFFECTWSEVYDFVEFVAQSYPIPGKNETFMRLANRILERELSAYRFVDGMIAPVVASEEIDAI